MRTVWDVVSAVAKRAGSTTAVLGERNLSYRDLLDRADEMSRRISGRIRPGSVVAVEVSAPVLAAIVILAVARAGGVLMPLSPDAPALHRQHMLADARPALLIRERDATANAMDVALDITGCPTADADHAAGAGLDGIAYVMHTSGSTGRSKGVLVSHDALIDRLAGLAAYPGFGRGDSILAMTALSFDISLAELLLPLSVGGAFVAAPPGARHDPAIFAKAVSTYAPSVVQATPSFWRLALAWGWAGDQGDRLRLWCGGESLTSPLAAQLLSGCAELWNLYGPTEATIWATAARIRSADDIHLGRALPGTGVMLVDGSGEEITAPDRRGEILLCGTGLAAGYLNQPRLTAERFQPRVTGEGRRPCYRTGDLAAYRADGALEFVGRVDGQIKLRGHRIELGGVEAVAEAHPAVVEAAAVLRDAERPDRAHIALFVVTDGTVTGRALRTWLVDCLPPAMRPGRIAVRSTLPRTTAGKIDRVRLAGEG